MAYSRFPLLSFLLITLTAHAWDSPRERKARIRGIRDYARQGSSAIPRIEPYLQDVEDDVRWEAVKAIAGIGSQRCLDPLIAATRDARPEIQVRTTDGLVNFYLPGYLKTGLTASLGRTTTALKGRFTGANTEIIDSYVTVRPDVIESLAKLVRSGATMEVRANAARAVGILRGRAALPDLYDALHSKNDMVLYEALIAVQKIKDLESGPKVQFLLRDLQQRVQIAAIETAGILRNRAALSDLRDVLDRARTARIRRAALTSIAMLPDEASRTLYARYFDDRDEGIRGAAAEGYGRLKTPSDLPTIEKAFQEESRMAPRLSLAFAMVMLGRRELAEFSALQYLINTLNSKSHRDSAQPLLVELARDPEVRKAIYPALSNPQATREEKIRLARVLGQTGDKDTMSVLEPFKGDNDAEVAQEGVRAIRNLTARLP